MSLTVTNTANSFTLTQRESIDLEVKLNASIHGHNWVHIGNALYNFGSTTGYKKDMILEVDNIQYMFLTDLMKTTT